MKKLLVLMLTVLTVFLLSTISAATIDNRNYFYPEVGEYGKVEIKDWFGLLKLSELELKENTEICIDECYAEKEIIMYQKGALVDDVRFIDLQNNQETDIKEYNFEIYKDSKWIDYNYEEVEKGTYQLRLEGKILPFQSVDWQIKSQGIWIEDWAIWTSGLNEQLLHYWNFDENTGTNIEDSRGATYGKQYNGTLFNNAVFREGKNNYGIYLDGTDDFVNLTVVGTSNINGSSNFTINIWTNGTASSFASLFADDVSSQNFDFMDGGDQTIYGYMENSAWSGSSDNATYDGSNWTMLTWTRKGDNQTLYSDGYIFASSTRTQTPTQANTFRFGTDASEANDFEGMIDEYAFWNRTLTDDEVLDLWNGGTGIFYQSTFNHFVIIYPENTTYNEEVTNLNYTIVDVDYCWQSSDGGVTNTSAVVAGINWTTLSSTEGSNIWTLFCNDTAGIQYNDSITFTVDSYGPNISVIQPRGGIDLGEINMNLTLNWTAVDISLDSCWYDYNGTNTSVTCSENTTGVLITDSINRNLTFYANDSVGNTASNYTSWTYKIFVNNISYNATTYETASEKFKINVTSDGTQQVSAVLYYNGTNKGTATKTGNNSEMIFTSTADINLADFYSNKSFFWSINYGSENINNSEKNQSVNLIMFDFCNVTLNTSYINFSFKDETDDSDIIASIPTSTFDYWLGDGSVNKTLTFINTTANPEYLFCLTPVDKNINVDMSIQYKNITSYPQRTYESIKTLTNSTTNLTLYLLNTINGIYVTFQVVTAGGDPIEGVIVNATRVVGSETVIVGSGVTDSAGGVTFWLNPDFEHFLSFYKPGYDLYTTSITPTQSTYTITLGITTTSTTVDYNRGISITILPSGSFINSDTAYSFNYTISTSYHLLDGFGFNFTYKNGTQINYQSSITDTGGTLNYNFNTANYTKLIMNYYYTINSTQINVTKEWLISSSNSFSLWHLFSDLVLYIDADIFGILGDDDGYFAKALICVVIIIMVSGGLSLRYGVMSEQAISGIIFSVLLLLNILNFIPTPDSFLLRNVNLGNFLVAIMALVTIAFIFKEEQR